MATRGTGPRARGPADTDGTAPRLDERLGNVLFDVWLVSRATTALVDEAVRASGLNADEFAVYSVLTTKDALTPGELARWMSAPATTVSSYVKRLEARGHLRRLPNPRDARSYVLGLTAGGRRAHRAAVDAFTPTLRHVVDQLGPHEPAVRGALAALRDILDGMTTG